VDFMNRRKERESEKEKEPEDVEPVEGGAFAIEHFGLKAPRVNLAWIGRVAVSLRGWFERELRAKKELARIKQRKRYTTADGFLMSRLKP